MRAFPDEESSKKFAFIFEPIGPDISGIIAPGAIMDGPTAIMTVGEFRTGSTVIAARVEYNDVFSDELRESEVRMTVEWHPTAAGGTTFTYIHSSRAVAT
jgi:hypothetical protein